ncbi:MAG: peptidoglycan DD-metalloendopeptidase family protein [Candidatus Paceibacterota bacterium]
MQNILNKIAAAQVIMGVATLLAAVILAFVVQVSTAEAVSTMRLPLSSDPGINAWFDHQAGSGFKKYTCSTSGSYDGHEGTDFPTYLGRTIYAGANGGVYYRYDGCANSGSWGCGGGFGNHVRLEHSVDSLVSIYAHMKNGTPAWYSSLSCNLGATVGQVASSGNSSGNHLHLELWSDRYNNYEIDPFSGSCSQATSYWTNQNSGSPTTACQ